jgi:hypothetical protein
MATLSFLLGNDTITTPASPFLANCTLFSTSFPPPPYQVRSSVSPDVFREFLSAASGHTIALTRENLPGLTGLASEFGFSALSASAPSDDLRSRVRSLEDLTRAQTGRIERLRSQQIATAFRSRIVDSLPPLLSEFANRPFHLLWRGSRDGFSAVAFHRKCDGHYNTLVIIKDTDGNVFGGFTPVPWCSIPDVGQPKAYRKADPSRRSFLFSLKNPHGQPPAKFALKEGEAHRAVLGMELWGPIFGDDDLVVADECAASASSYTLEFGSTYENPTGKRGFFTESGYFTVREIEVIEVAM